MSLEARVARLENEISELAATLTQFISQQHRADERESARVDRAITGLHNADAYISRELNSLREQVYGSHESFVAEPCDGCPEYAD